MPARVDEAGSMMTRRSFWPTSSSQAHVWFGEFSKVLTTGLFEAEGGDIGENGLRPGRSGGWRVEACISCLSERERKFCEKSRRSLVVPNKE